MKAKKLSKKDKEAIIERTRAKNYVASLKLEGIEFVGAVPLKTTRKKKAALLAKHRAVKV